MHIVSTNSNVLVICQYLVIRPICGVCCLTQLVLLEYNNKAYTMLLLLFLYKLYLSLHYFLQIGIKPKRVASNIT